jgi:hypothetical protein
MIVTGTNDGGRVGETRKYLRRRLHRYQADLRTFSAIPIDATQPLVQVADAMIARTCC